MSTSKQDAQAARARAIAEALQASGARSLMELLAESERHKEHLEKLCAKLEALPKVVKKKRRGSDAPAKRMVEDRKLAAKEELKWRAEFEAHVREGRCTVPADWRASRMPVAAH